MSIKKKGNKKKKDKISDDKNRLQKEIDLIIKKAEEQNKVLEKLMKTSKKK